ncbi:hypothetical protein B0F90DRAFT_1693229 [Multifurca ochricompacta]|uniref:Uncharacterized protein n=1 Tax=Multifurca ochricompacta TaxID=376703 RepID=A0AAD4MAW6_9AGAM|nr:hypothetical protein B0F90DRAFT_1693229 [Multifurca ochricompacta]
MPSTTDNTTLVAPRPIRLSNFSIHLPSPHRPHSLRITSTPADPGDRLYSVDPPLDDDYFPDSISPKASPRASPRSSLPSEALEEFLSILRPSLFPPRSPILRSIKYPVSSFHDRSLSLPTKPLSGIDNLSVLPRDDSRTPVRQLGAPFSSQNDLRPETRFFGSSLLASPISRIHTRNPFQRHASYETPFSPVSYLPHDRALSPASVALPSPTPSELESI